MDENHIDCPTVQTIVEKFFCNFSKSKDELKNLTKKGRQIFEHRLKLFDTNEDNRCPNNKFIKFSCKIEGRIESIGETLK